MYRGIEIPGPMIKAGYLCEGMLSRASWNSSSLSLSEALSREERVTSREERVTSPSTCVRSRLSAAISDSSRFTFSWRGADERGFYFESLIIKMIYPDYYLIYVNFQFSLLSYPEQVEDVSINSESDTPCSDNSCHTVHYSTCSADQAHLSHSSWYLSHSSWYLLHILLGNKPISLFNAQLRSKQMLCRQ